MHIIWVSFFERLKLNQCNRRPLMQSWYWEFAFIRKRSTHWWSQDSNEASREFDRAHKARAFKLYFCVWLRQIYEWDWYSPTILYQNNCTSHTRVNYAILLMSLIHTMILMRLKYWHFWKSRRLKRSIFIISCHNCQLFIIGWHH